MAQFVGTSGYSYKEWKGIFYPNDLPAKRMLSFYAQHFSAVEINNTFYRMPAAETMRQWAAEVPEHFVFAIKAPQRITHQKKLVDVGDDVRFLADTCRELGSHRGPLLFQLPPFFRKDVGKLRTLLESVPRDLRVAMEFRHDSWADDEVLALLREFDAAWCQADTDEKPLTAIQQTATWGYLRLRRLDYSDAELERWRNEIAAQGWSDSYLFFKHEDEARGPQFARRFLAQVQPANAANL